MGWMDGGLALKVEIRLDIRVWKKLIFKRL